MTDMILMPKDHKWKMYLASGWFSPTAAEELDQLEGYFGGLEGVDMAAPRQIFVCPPDAPKEVQDQTFEGNLHHIETADFVFVNTRDKDIGTIWEAGYAYALGKPIIYYCAGLPPNAKFNLMLARSGIKVCTSFEELQEYIGRCLADGCLYEEPYSLAIE